MRKGGKRKGDSFRKKEESSYAGCGTRLVEDEARGAPSVKDPPQNDRGQEGEVSEDGNKAPQRPRLVRSVGSFPPIGIGEVPFFGRLILQENLRGRQCLGNKRFLQYTWDRFLLGIFK